MNPYKLYLMAFLLLALPAIRETRAQSYENVDITATAEVLSELSMTKNSDVDFGKISATTPADVILDPQGLAHAYVGALATVGEIAISGSADQLITLTFPVTVTLDGTIGDAIGQTLTWTLLVSGHIDPEDQSTSTDLAPGGESVNTHPTSGDYYLWIGGDFGTLGSGETPQATGTYTGTANFTVTYN